MGFWKNTEQAGRGQIKKKLVCHVKGQPRSERNGKPQKNFKQDSDNMRFVFCKNYCGSFMEKLRNQIDLSTAIFTH